MCIFLIDELNDFLTQYVSDEQRAARDLTLQTRNKMLWNLTNGYFISIRTKVLFRNTLCYWQYNILLHRNINRTSISRKIAVPIFLFRSRFQNFIKHEATFIFKYEYCEESAQESTKLRRIWELLFVLKLLKYPQIFPEGKAVQSVKLTSHLHLVPRLRISGAIPLLPLYAWIG